MKKISVSTKLTIQVVSAVVLIIAGIVLLFLGFWTAPIGQLHDSVLIAYGEMSTFAGSLLGLDYNYRYKIFEASREGKLPSLPKNHRDEDQ